MLESYVSYDLLMMFLPENIHLYTGFSVLDRVLVQIESNNGICIWIGTAIQRLSLCIVFVFFGVSLTAWIFFSVIISCIRMITVFASADWNMFGVFGWTSDWGTFELSHDSSWVQSNQQNQSPTNIPFLYFGTTEKNNRTDVFFCSHSINCGLLSHT